MNKKFEYQYSAPTEEEKKQIESIRRAYAKEEPQAESKIEQLKALDKKVRNSATAVALIVGIVGCLLFGVGLTLVLEWKNFLWGIIVMAIGCLPMIAAYPLHGWVLEKGKKKYGARILALSEELLKE